jgi:D-arabinose 1-dehydrogenase-like Zn-dependent alcohol dehydrogenase
MCSLGQYMIYMTIRLKCWISFFSIRCSLKSLLLPLTRNKMRFASARKVVISRDTDQMSKHVDSFDFIIDAVSAEHDINAYIQSLRSDGNITVVGAPDKPHVVSALSLLFKRRSLSGSLIGGIAEAQEMLDFCGKHNITADVEGHLNPEGQRGLRETV